MVHEGFLLFPRSQDGNEGVPLSGLPPSLFPSLNGLLGILPSLSSAPSPPLLPLDDSFHLVLS